MDIIIYFALYAMAGGIYFCIASYREEVQKRKQAETKCKQLEQDLALANDANERLLQTIEDMEEEDEDADVDYSIMATMIEEHTQQFADVHKWMDLQDRHMNVHCQHLDLLDNYVTQPFQVQLVGGAQSQDECNENPYPEPEPEILDSVKKAINEVEGLDGL